MKSYVYSHGKPAVPYTISGLKKIVVGYRYKNYERARIESHTRAHTRTHARAHTYTHTWIRPGFQLRWVSSISELYNINKLYKTKPLFHFNIIVCKYVE